MKTLLITKNDEKSFQKRVERMRVLKEKDFFKTRRGIVKATSGVRELLSRMKQKIADSYWEDVRSNLLNLSPDDPAFTAKGKLPKGIKPNQPY